MTEWKSWTIPPEVIRLVAYGIAIWYDKKFTGTVRMELEKVADNVLAYIYKEPKL